MSQIIIRVVNRNGSVVRGTLLAADTSAFSNEVSTGGAFGVNHQFPNVNDTALSSLAVELGDRIVIELGLRYNTTGSFGGIIPGIHVGATAATDLPEDQTDTTANIWPWLEFSNTITFEAATRFYFPSNGAPADGLTPAVDASWEISSSVWRSRMRTAKQSSPFANKTQSVSTATNDGVVMQFISDPLAIAQTITGTVKGIFRCMESNAAADQRAQVNIRVLSRDGVTVRGTLLAHNAAALTSEFATTLTNRKFPLAWVDGGATLTPVAALAGDRVCVEIGFRQHAAGAQTGTIELGDSHASDLAEDETSTSQFNPWLEFSEPLQFEIPDATSRRGLSEPNFTEIGVVQPHGGPLSMVAPTLMGDSTERGGTTSRRHGGDLIQVLGIPAADFMGRGHYSAPYFPDFQHSTTDLPSNRRPTEPYLPVVQAKNLVLPIISNISPAAPTTVNRDDTVAFRVTDDGGLFRRIIVGVVFADGRTEIIHNGTSFSSAYADLSTRTPVVGPPDGFDYVLSRVDTASPYGDAPGWLTASFTLRVWAIDEDGNESATTSVGLYTVANPAPGPQIYGWNPASGSSILRTATVGVTTEDEQELSHVEVTVEHASGLVEVVYDGTALKAPYTGSTLFPTPPNVLGFLVLRGGLGWPSSSFTVKVRAFDNDGNETQDSATYTVTNPWDASAPQVTNVSPPTGTPIARSAPVFFDVTDDSGLFRRVIVTASYEDGSVDVVHDGDGFAAKYNQGSTRSVITNGYHYRVQRLGGWPYAPTIRAYAIDQSGNENS